MKRILSTLTLLLCFVFTAVNAQVITVERAAEIANSFFSAGVQKSGAARGVVASSSLTTSFDSNDVVDTASAEPTFYVLTNPGGGFVIVSGEETENPIIGYSFDGTINADNLPIGFVDYMTDIDAQVKALREYNANNPQKSAAARSAMARTNYATSMGNIVRNLQVAKFHQDAPFNNLCKTANGSAASAGCVPIAYAMLCNYYNWPVSATGKGVHSATGETITFGYEYDWDNILDDYSGTYTTAQADAVATLVRDLGYAYQVSYGTGGTGSELKGEGAAILIEQFGFKSLSTTHASQTYATTRDVMADDDRWKGLIKDCLDKNYPIPYSAYNTSTKGRHIFMLDGYTDNDYYHFNWGWGDGNGWFTLDNMVPSTNKTYTSQHYAYFYLIPNKTEYAVKVTVGEGEGTVSINNGTPGTTATADLFSGATATLTAHPADGYALASWTKNGVVVGTKNSIQVTVGTDANDYVANFAEASTVTVIQDYIINATSGTALTTTKVQEWAFNANNDYPAALKLTSATESINTNNAGDCIQLYLMSGTTATYTLSVPEDYVITKYTIRCKTSSTYITSIAAEGQTYTPTKNYADYTFTKNTQARGAANSSELTIEGSANRALMVEAITVTIAKEGANVPSTPTTYIIYATAGAGGSVTINDDAVSQKSVNEGTTVTLVATPQTGYRFVNWTSGTSTVVSTDATYSFKATGNTSLVANFEETDYTVTVAAGEGGVAYIGTKGTTSTTANYNDNLTITAEANDGYEFVEWRAFDSHFTSNAQQDVTVTADVTYTAVFRSTTQQGGSSSTNLAGKYFRLKTTVNSAVKYMNVGTDSDNSHGNVNMVDLNETSDDQIFLFEQSGDGYKLKARSGNYIKCAEWNVNANTTNANEASVLLFEKSGDGYLIKWNNTYKNGGTIKYFNIQTAKAGDRAYHPYSDGDYNAAAVWVLEEVVYYTVTAKAGEGGSVSLLTSTIEKDKPVTLTATADEGYRFVNWTLNGNVVSTDASYTFNATAAGEYVANFEISTYTISATANPGTAGSVTINGEAVSSKNVNENSTVTLVATPQAGYCFVNWTKDRVEVSTDATYSFTATEITSLVANFEQIVVNVTLTDAQSNTYNVQLSGFTSGVKKETVAAKLTEKYPYITLGTTDQEGKVIDFGVLEANGTAYTYTNKVELPFKVSNAAYIWHNIYYPSNGGNPNYIAALNEDEVVDMAASKDYAYGDNPTYNTKDGGNSICWAIYNVNNSFEFIFKSRVTDKYIKVESVVNATGNTQNVKFVDNAGDATAFTLLKDTDSYNGDYALVANIDERTGYLCAISSDEDYVTHFDHNNHEGAWVKFKEAPDYFSMIMDLGTMLGLKFGAGDGKCIITPSIQGVIDAMQNSGSITLNALTEYGSRIEGAMNNWPAVGVTINPAEGGTTNINGEENVVHKYVPNGYELPLAAVPAVGYHFVSWTDGTSEVETAEYTKTISGGKGDVIELTANFAKNTYAVSVTAGEGGSASVTHDVNGETVDINGKTVDFATVIKIEATPNDGYKFIGWYNGEELQHSINPHEFAINHDINYTARFEKEEAGSTTNKYVIKINAILTDGETAVNNATGNVQAIINGIGLDWATSAEVDENARVELVAISDHNQSAYLFEGWYKNGNLVSPDLRCEVSVTETVTYEARFAKGKVIKLTSNNKSLCYPNMPTYTDGSKVAGTITDLRAVVRDGEELLISIDDSVIAYFTGEGYRVANWTDKDGDEVAGKNVYSFTIKVNGDNTYKVNLEKDTYTLTVSTEGTMGTVHIGDGTETSVTVNNGGTAKITAKPNSGCKFVNWTLNGVVVSTENPYNVPAITDNVQYVAVFAETDALDAGYYRIAYDFEVPVAAKSVATRAAGESYTYIVTPEKGGITNATKVSEWNSTETNPVILSMTATCGGTPVATIQRNANTSFKLYGYNAANQTEIKYTISVPDGYIITNYQFTCLQRSAGVVTIKYAGNEENYGDTSGHTISVSPNDKTAEFVLSTTSTSNNWLVVKEFTVTIQPVGGETPEPETETVRYYMQSVACGVSGGNNLQNALQMTTDGEGVSSIFYYDGGKLLSYQEGTYVNENGGIRGLQAVGVYEGDKTNIKVVGTNDEDENICTIAAPNYMHANSNGTTYYVDHCGSNPDNHAANHNFVLEKVTSLPVTITDAGYASWYAPVAVELPDGIEAWYFNGEIAEVGDVRYAIMAPIGDNVDPVIVPANTGVILGGLAGDYELKITETETEIEGNLLKGTVATEYVTDNAYVLSKPNGKEIGFYLADMNKQNYTAFQNNSHKAYLPMDFNSSGDAQQSAGFVFRFSNNTTAIEEVETESSEVNAIYDLTGRKLEGISGTGIYIINGKKVIIR